MGMQDVKDKTAIVGVGVTKVERPGKLRPDAASGTGS